MEKMRIGQMDIETGNLFETVIENFPDIIHSVDNEGHIVVTNQAAERLLGYSREELLGMHIRQLYAPEIMEAVEAGFTKLKDQGDDRVESLLVHKDGTRIPVEIRSFSIYDDKGNFKRTFSILRDIRKLKELQNGLIHAERLAAIGEMASGIVHDINNPLMVIKLYGELMRTQVKQLAEQHNLDVSELLESMEDEQKAACAIEKLANHLRNFSRGVEEDKQPFDLHQSITDALFLLASKIKKNKVHVVSQIEGGKHFSYGRPNKAEQVFANLFSNACDAMADTDTRDLAIDIEEVTVDDQAFWRCRVADSGCGIPEEIQDEVFQSFFTTKEKGKGTGLGLSITAGIVEEHQGKIEIESTPGEGTAFLVYFPVRKLAVAAG